MSSQETPGTDLQAAEDICAGKRATCPQILHLQAALADRNKWRTRAIEQQRELTAVRHGEDYLLDDDSDDPTDAIFPVERVH